MNAQVCVILRDLPRYGFVFPRRRNLPFDIEYYDFTHVLIEDHIHTYELDQWSLDATCKNLKKICAEFKNAYVCADKDMVCITMKAAVNNRGFTAFKISHCRLEMCSLSGTCANFNKVGAANMLFITSANNVPADTTKLETAMQTAYNYIIMVKNTIKAMLEASKIIIEELNKFPHEAKVYKIRQYTIFSKNCLKIGGIIPYKFIFEQKTGETTHVEIFGRDHSYVIKPKHIMSLVKNAGIFKIIKRAEKTADCRELNNISTIALYLEQLQIMLSSVPYWDYDLYFDAAYNKLEV